MGELVSYLCLFVNNIRQRVLTIWVTWWMSYKRQELPTLREHLGSSRFLICEFLIFLDFCIVFCLSWSCVLFSQYCHCLLVGHSWLPFLLSLTFINIPDTIPIVKTRCRILVATNDKLRPINAKKPPNIPHFIGPNLVTIIPDTKP